MNHDTPRTDLCDLSNAMNHANPNVRRAVTTAVDEIEKLRARVKELERHSDWHIDMVVGDAWLCRIEGKFEDIDRLLGEAVGKQIQSYEIDTQHHEESFDPAQPDAPAA